MKKNKDHSWKDKAAGKIAGAGIKLQTKFAVAMNKGASAVPAGKMKILLILFCVVWGGLSFYFIGNAVFRSDQKQPSYRVEPIRSPKHFDKTGDEIYQSIVDEETYRQIQAFKKSPYYDSTIRARPGLLDSILLLEEIYHSQKIK